MSFLCAPALLSTVVRPLSEAFMRWIAQGVVDEHLVVNFRQACIHGVAQGTDGRELRALPDRQRRYGP